MRALTTVAGLLTKWVPRALQAPSALSVAAVRAHSKVRPDSSHSLFPAARGAPAAPALRVLAARVEAPRDSCRQPDGATPAGQVRSDKLAAPRKAAEGEGAPRTTPRRPVHRLVAGQAAAAAVVAGHPPQVAAAQAAQVSRSSWSLRPSPWTVAPSPRQREERAAKEATVCRGRMEARLEPRPRSAAMGALGAPAEPAVQEEAAQAVTPLASPIRVRPRCKWAP